MTERTLPENTRIMFGAPSNPISESKRKALRQAIMHVPGICEAYLPQTLIEGHLETQQVLVLSIKKQEMIPEVMQLLMEKLNHLISEDTFIDIMPFASEEFPAEARIAKCLIFGSPKSAWWKVW